MEDVAGCDELFQGAHGGGMKHRNEIHDAVTHSQGVHGWSVYVLTDNKEGSISTYTMHAQMQCIDLYIYSVREHTPSGIFVLVHGMRSTGTHVIIYLGHMSSEISQIGRHS